MSDFIRLIQACKENVPLMPAFGYRETFQPNFEMQFHRHNVLEVMYASKGNFDIYIISSNSERKFKVTVPENHYIFINSGVYHYLHITEPDVSILNIEFALDATEPFCTHLNELYTHSESFRKFAESDRDYYLLKCHPKQKTLLEEMLNVLSFLPKVTDFTNNTLTEKVVENLLLLNHYTYYFFFINAKTFNSSPTNFDSHNITTITKYIIDNLYDDNLSTKKIAEQLHLSSAYLSSVFKKHMNTNITSYINQQRVSHAMSLLTTTSMPIIDIGIHVGFNNRQHFARTFRMYANCSPLEFRKATSHNFLKNYEGNTAYPTEKISKNNYDN